VQVTTREVVIATAEPFVREWENELRPILRKEIRRVLANPDDIGRYLVEFFNLAKSVKKAAQRRKRFRAVELRATGRAGQGQPQFDANDQHIVHIVDWLWQYAFEQRASRHPHRAAARLGHRALPHRRRAASGLPDPDGGDDGDDQPHQAARRAWT
jgi:hypothetical protein